jgi:hypothetical protein
MNLPRATGAVEYSRRPELVFARRSRLGYGVRVAQPFSDRDPLESKFWNDGAQCYYTDSAFCRFVAKDQLVGVDDTVEHIFTLMHRCGICWPDSRVSWRPVVIVLSPCNG